MIFIYNEDSYEQSILELFSILGYKHLIGYEIDRDYQNPLYMDELESSLLKINKDQNKNAIYSAIEKLQNIDIGSLEERNDKFMNYLQNGVSVNYVEDNEERSTLIKIIDFETIENNTFTVINQWTVVEKETKRPDIIVFVNGLPLVVCELKSPSREDADTSQAYTQLWLYLKQELSHHQKIVLWNGKPLMAVMNQPNMLISEYFLKESLKRTVSWIY